jgi:hypothetical protein
MSEDNRQQNPDEIVLENVKLFHAEQMNNKIYHLNISAKGDKLVYWWSDETHDF